MGVGEQPTKGAVKYKGYSGCKWSVARVKGCKYNIINLTLYSQRHAAINILDIVGASGRAAH